MYYTRKKNIRISNKIMAHILVTLSSLPSKHQMHILIHDVKFVSNVLAHTYTHKIRLQPHPRSDYQKIVWLVDWHQQTPIDSYIYNIHSSLLGNATVLEISQFYPLQEFTLHSYLFIFILNSFRYICFLLFIHLGKHAPGPHTATQSSEFGITMNWMWFPERNVNGIK